MRDKTVLVKTPNKTMFPFHYKLLHPKHIWIMTSTACKILFQNKNVSKKLTVSMKSIPSASWICYLLKHTFLNFFLFKYSKTE